jgi:ssDNA thymidine ADP-ribosyltransferase, DarT
MNLEQINVYRITHIDNIPHILEYGITHKNSPNANPNFINIGDVSLIDTRSAKYVKIDNGDFTNNDCSKVLLGDFIPFYFGVKMPMMYVIQNGGNFVKKATPAHDIVYLVYPINPIIESDNEFYFSDGHATDNLTTFYDKSKTDELPDLIDWDAIKAPFWGGQNNLNVKRKKQAEFLVKDDLKHEFLRGIVCYNQSAKQKLINIGVEEEKIKIFPQAYY